MGGTRRGALTRSGPGRLVDETGGCPPTGQPVAGLQAGDIEVVAAGRRIAVSAVYPQAPAAAAGFPPRRVVVVVNRPSMPAGTGQEALDQVAAFLERFPAAEYAAAWPIPAAVPSWC